MSEILDPIYSTPSAGTWHRSPDEITQADYPILYNLSAAFTMSLMPVPKETRPIEFVTIDATSREDQNEWCKKMVFIHQWNHSWEAGHLRLDMHLDDLPRELAWLHKVEDRNVYLLPWMEKRLYSTYSVLYHLLPAKTLLRHGLPLVDRGMWPVQIHARDVNEGLPGDFNERLALAFADHIWPLLDTQSQVKHYATQEPIKVLAHNLNYWLPYAYQVAEQRMRSFPRIPTDPGRERKLRLARTEIGDSIDPDFTYELPLTGGAVWRGEEEAWEATKDMVALADGQGRLRAMMDAIRSNRVTDDFSEIWSYAREDFERKLYSKRSKIRIAFVEIDDTIPVHSPSAEMHDTLLWENLLALVDEKERRVVVCLRSGITGLTEIARHLGYANHSPISKQLARIRRKTKKLLDA